MTYRDDIDGLRAIAVIAVIFSHIHLMPGGYIGVDVFFVISGFLIAPRILEKMKSNEFSIFDFYTRRAKRLLPQVYAVILASFVAAYLLFAPSDIIAFGKSAIATVLYGSNFYFLAQTGYFAPDAITQPLLHTWSLAVEEQFYFIAPLIIYGLVKLQRPLLFGALIGLASLLACLLTTQFWTSANFFMLPFRAWEFIIGAAIAYVPLPPRNFRNVSAFSGLALITLSALTLKETSLFPGVNAVPVVAGTALIIWSGSATILAKVLATLPLRLTGRASYSLYIWHWPIIVFYSYYSYNDFSFNAQLQMLVATFIAGFLFWYVFEEPIRKSKITFRFAVIATVSASLSVVAVSLFIKHEKGIPQRLNEAARLMAGSVKDKSDFLENCIKPVRADHLSEDVDTLCKLGAAEGAATFALWGDSFSAAIAYGLSEEAKKFDLTGVLLSVNSCPPIINTEGWWEHSRAECRETNEQAVNIFKSLGVKTVFIHAAWGALNGAEYINSLSKSVGDLKTNDHQEYVNAGVAKTITAFKNAGIKVVFVNGIPTADKNIVQQLARKLQTGNPVDLRLDRKALEASNARATIAFGRHPEVETLNPMELLCDESKCAVEMNGKAITVDGGHLSQTGSRLLSGLFSSTLSDL